MYFDMFYDHLAHGHALLSFALFSGNSAIFCGNLLYFPYFGMLHQEKSGNPGDYIKQDLD
jgi:hypothetical protein